MLIDCDTCVARGPACGDCVVSVLLRGTPDAVGPPAAPGPGGGEPGSTVELDGAEQAAIAVLAGSGLVPPLRLVPAGGTARGCREDGCGRGRVAGAG